MSFARICQDIKKAERRLLAIWDKHGEAIKRAKQIAKNHVVSGTDNPSTGIYKVVEDLENLSK